MITYFVDKKLSNITHCENNKHANRLEHDVDYYSEDIAVFPFLDIEQHVHNVYLQIITLFCFSIELHGINLFELFTMIIQYPTIQVMHVPLKISKQLIYDIICSTLSENLKLICTHHAL